MFHVSFSGPPDIATLCKELGKAESKWFKIGTHSDVPFDKLKEFEKESYPLAAVFNYCLKGNVKVSLTWKSVCDTLKDIDECELAEMISKKYCRVKESRKKMKEKEHYTQEILPSQEDRSLKCKGELPIVS